MFGTPLQPSATRMLLLGSGELGREVVIEAMRLGIEVIACDRYADAPAMQLAHRAHVLDMQDPAQLREVIELERPTFIVPEIEAIATQTLVELEREGFTVVPTARAAQLTMDREGIRRLAAEDLGVRTSPYRFAETLEEVRDAVAFTGLPCVIKPIMSSSGKGQSTVRSDADVEPAWRYAREGSRGRSARMIVEGFVTFDTEITLLTVRTRQGTVFCPPIGHLQESGDYIESWQPEALSPAVLAESQRIAKLVTDALGGYGLFGVELFIAGDEVFFSEVSPRPHDTGMVTIGSQGLTEFELHVRAILGLPIADVLHSGPGASAVIRATEAGVRPRYEGVADAMAVDPTVRVRLFGKPDARPGRRMGVVTASAATTDAARALARDAAARVRVLVDPTEG